MPDWTTLGGGNRIEVAGAVTAASDSINCTSAAGADTKGSYTQIIASTAFHAYAIGINIKAGTITSGQMLVDIAIGAGGSEQVIVENIYLPSRINEGTAFFITIPIPIPAGTRIAARCQDNAGSEIAFVEVYLYGARFLEGSSLSRVITHGADTANSKGTAVDAGAVAHTKGSYAQMVASTANPTKLLYIMAGPNEDFVRAASDHLYDVAVGAAASEQVIIPNVHLVVSSSSDRPIPDKIGPIPVNIPEGSRIAIRQQANTTDAGDRILDFVLLGVD